jgi:hypothetical protein
MLRTTQDIVELRRWAEARGARPCRDPGSGRLGLAVPGVPCTAQEVGWDEFEPAFAWLHAVFVCDDAPGARRWFIGSIEDAHAFVARETTGGAYAPPR